MTAPGSPFDEEQPEGPVIRDRRRLDPETGEVRQPAPPSGSTAAGGPAAAGAAASPEAAPDDAVFEPLAGDRAGAETVITEPVDPLTVEPSEEEVAPLAALQLQVEERTEDLRRVTAEYANYRKRVDRDRGAMVDAATAGVLQNLLPVLDDVDRAAEHGDLQGTFATVGEALRRTVEKLGLERFGQPGEPFDPSVHEAMTFGLSPDVTETTAVQVFQPGYRLGQRVLRPARVAVADPGEPEPPATDQPAG